MTGNIGFKHKAPKLAKQRNLYFGENIQCERCLLLDFRFKKLAKHIHHKNTNRKDNRDENLMLVCPDCHRALHKELRHNSSDTNPYLPFLEMSYAEFFTGSYNNNNNNNY